MNDNDQPDNSRTPRRRRRSAEVPRPDPRPGSAVWTVYLVNQASGKAWFLGRVMGSTDTIALRAARKRWTRYAESVGLIVRPLTNPWPEDQLERRALPKGKPARKDAK